MRTIKFRAWSNGKMVYQNNALSKMSRFWRIIEQAKEHGEEFVIMQFTGLHDKSINNICIYEGDIISLQGILIGNKYETPEVLKNETNFLIEGIGTKTWTQTEKEGLARGLHYTK